MKKIAIVLFVATITLTSCGGGAEKCEGENCSDTCKVASVVTDTTVAVKADSTKVDTTSAVK